VDEKVFRVQVRHIRSCVASLRLFDLRELEESAQQFGTDADKDLVAALLLALDTLPNDSH
jgi:hypothetical protein